MIDRVVLDKFLGTTEVLLADYAKDFTDLRESNKGTKRILEKLASYEISPNYLKVWHERSCENRSLYPSQGLMQTPFDNLDYQGTRKLDDDLMVDTLRAQTYFLELFNHPYRIYHLIQVSNTDFVPPPAVNGNIFRESQSKGVALSIRDIAATIHFKPIERVSRSERYAQGPFVKLGRQARSPFVGSESPDVWNSAPAVALMAASHCLAAIPRNGVLQDINRQSDFAKEVFRWLDYYEELILKNRPDRQIVAQMWRANVMGTLEASPDKGLVRAESLSRVGVSTFRPYSPEPGMGSINTTKELRYKYGNEIEIFSGQGVSIEQLQLIEDAGADGIVIGIGGGGRCITGPRSGLAIDWPELLWESRGNVNIPIIVQGGASDHVAETLQLGASGIGVSRMVAGGTIESPGGALYYVDSEGKLFKPYGGEASARNKYNEGKMLPFNVPSFVEGETTKAYINFVAGNTLPSLTYNLHALIENAILALVFKSCNTIEELQAIDPSPLRVITSSGEDQRKAH